jgi:cysteine-rich repeat protein
VDGDGCSADCVTEALPFCGDGELDAQEECDDANRVAGDGCSARCLIEAPSMPDGGVPTPDAGMPDAGVPGTPLPVGGTVTGGCSVGYGSAPLDPIACLGMLGLALVRRTRRRA